MRFSKLKAAAAAFTAFVLCPTVALAAEEHGLPGASMALWWALPFAGLLLSIATGPLLFPHVWEHHYGKIAALWAALVIVPLAVSFGASIAAEEVVPPGETAWRLG